MYLKRIELYGFKSFPHKKELVIGEGITGVVGPNGSGKSNIADALRWVLGEQSSKNLRGATMQDVIFNGTQSRPKKGYCEVSLTFDNQDSQVDTAFSEICVRRKMYRSGESEYSINNSNCRLKDVLELFRDTGIGKEGYSIIGQGRIDEILNNKAVQRRRVFEEAAGITKYRVRKEEAERNLQKTKDNIIRIDDIIAELEIQIGPLEEQMKEARDYISLRERLKELEINLFLYQHERAGERMEKTEQQIKEQQQEYDDLTKQLEQGSEAQAEIKQQLARLQDDIDAHNTKVGDLMRRQEQLKGESALIEEKEKNSREAQQENTQKQEQLENEIAEKTKQIEEINSRIQELNGALDEKYEAISELRELVTDGTPGDAENMDALRQEMERIRTALQTRRIDLNESQVKTELLEKQRGALAASQQAAKEEIAALEGEDARIEKELLGYTAENEKLRQRQNELAQGVLELRAQQEETDEGLEEITRGIDEDRSRLQLLNEMREGHEGYFDSVRRLLKRAKDDPGIAGRIKGVLAELVDVPKKYETAIEVILGNALQNVVVEKDSDAKRIIDFLRSNDLGRVTFLPAQSLKIKYLKKHEQALLNEPGVVGVASETISCAAEIRPAVDFLLARTVIVEDMDSAIALMRKAEYGFRTVTLEGDFINPGGAITGGSMRRNQTGLLSRKRMAEELERSLEQRRKERTQIKEKAAGREEELAKMETRQQEIVEQMRQQELASVEVRQKHIALQNQLDAKTEALQTLEAELRQAEAQYAGLEQSAATAQQDAARLQQEFAETEERLQAAEEKRANEMKQSEETRQRLSALEMEHAEVNHRKSILLNESEHLRDAVATAQAAMQEAGEQNEALKKELEEIRRRKLEMREQTDDALTDLKNADALVKDKFDERERLNAEQEENEKKAERITEQQKLLIEQKYRLIANKEKTELARETAQNKIWEDYMLTYANAHEYKMEGFAYQNSVREVEEIRERMREMGAVNPNAIEDYARVKDRYDNLTLQRDDLVKAGDDLRIVIDDLLVGMTASFKEKFTLIDENFQRVFKELFGGGHAQLELQDEENVMECGIEIIAEPPGKKLQNISLLSGGEKALTAIALLFAMLAINPSPVCLLDEIDAPLDDANLIRFSEYLTKMSKELQFIVITHRKPTMSICDTLYGIAMHEKGVSDVVSVRLES